jgi:PAS domain S-box-containing protein
LFGLLPVGITVVNYEGKVVKINPELVKMLALSPEEISKSDFSIRNYFRLDGSPIPESEIVEGRVLKEKNPIYLDIGIEKKNKEKVWLEVKALPCKLSDWAGVIVSTDITERRQREAKLKEQVDELNRWHQVTLGRENRVMELKREINDLLQQMGKPPKYSSIEQDN